MIRTLRALPYVFALLCLTWLGVNYREAASEWLDRTIYPPKVQGRSTLANPIEESLRRRRLAAFRIEARRVQAKIDAARSEGLNVDELPAKIDGARALAESGQFSPAQQYLNSIEFQVPRKREVVAPAAPDPSAELQNAAPKTPAKPHRRSRAKKRRRP